MTDAIIFTGFVSACIASWIAWRAMWLRGASFADLVFFGETMWVFEGLVATAGYDTPALSIVSLDEGRRRVVYAGSGHEVLAYLGDAGTFTWWWSSRKGLHTRDNATGAIVHDERAIVAKAGALAGKLVPRSDDGACNHYANAGKGAILVRLTDATVVRVDDKLTATREESEWREVHNGYHFKPASSTYDEAKLASGHVIALWKKNDVATLHVDKKPIDATFLGGVFAWDRGRGRILELDDPPSVLVVHRDKLGSGANLLLSRVTIDGRTLWTRSESDYGARRDPNRDLAPFAYAGARPEGVYIVLYNIPYTIVLVDPATGDAIKRYPRLK